MSMTDGSEDRTNGRTAPAGLVARSFAAALLAFTSSGCAVWTNVHERAPLATPLPETEAEPRLPLVIEVVTLKSSGNEMTVSEAFVDRVTARMRSTKLFSAVYSPREVNQAPPGAAVMRYEIDSDVDSNKGSAATKGVFIGLSLYVLTPVLPLSVDKVETMSCEVELPDRTVRRYRATTDATTWFHLFASAYAAGTELDATVTNSNFDSIVTQMKADPLLVGRLVED